MSNKQVTIKKKEIKEKKGIDVNKTRKRKIKVMNVSPIVIEKKKERLNEKLSKLMSDLYNIMLRHGDNIRARVYKRAEETIMSMNEDITDIEQLKGKQGIGPTILEKCKEYLETGTLRILEREKDRPENILLDVYGIGPKKAKELVDSGITSIAQLREKQNDVLNDVQKIGLKYYEDILERIPREEIDKYNIIFDKTIKQINDKESKYEIVGSYRRGLSSSGDIDVIITSKDPNSFVQFINLLIESKIIIEILSRGKSKCLVIAKIPYARHARRVDFLYSTIEEFPFSILYFTGSKSFNTVMRGHALKMGFTLNEHAMSKIVDKKKEEKVDHLFKEEKDIFDFLKLEYKSPEERIDGRSIIPLTASSPTPVAPKVVKKNITKKKASVLKETKVENVVIPSLPPQNILQTSPVPAPEAQQSPKSDKKTTKKKRENIKKNIPINEVIHDFKTKGIQVLEVLNEKQLSSIIKLANDNYYNETPLLTDNEYDIIKEYIEKKYPNNKAIKQIGAPVSKNKVKLPYEMASMDKIKPDTNALSNWTKKYDGPYVLSCKLDGVSGLYVNEKGVEKLYTRGDGIIGQDITHLLSILNLPKKEGYAIRGEFIIPKKVFETKYKEKFANPRNLVSGIVNSKTLDEKAKDIHFVAYEVINPPLKPSEQMSELKTLKHEVVMNKTLKELSNDKLSEILLEWRKEYEYEIDGVIVTNDKIYPRQSGNPEHAFAFKMVISDQVAEAKVVDVIWTPSKNGLLKPRVRIEPVQLGGVTIEYATGFNGKFIEENKIGIGSVIQIIRSGDVIPYIKSVTVQAEQAKMPDVPYTWTSTHVDVILENIEDDITVREKNVTTFFVTLKVDGLSSGNIKRFFNAGFDSVPEILKMKKEDFEKIEGFKSKLIEKIYTSIHENVEKATLIDIMVASNKIGKGLGEKKIKPIMDAFPNILTSGDAPESKIDKLKSIKGIGDEIAKEFVINIPHFMCFLYACGLEKKLSMPISAPSVKPENIDTSHPLYNKKIVMSKIRDKEIIDSLSKYGALLEDSMKKDTFVLIVKSKEETSNKIDYAIKNNISIMTPEEFKQKYLL